MHHPATTTRMGALTDVVIVFVVIVLIKAIAYQFIWKFAGPISLLFGVAVATILIKRRGFGWRDYGLGLLANGKSYLLLFPQAVLVFLMLIIVSISVYFVVDPIFPKPETIEDRFEGIAGNLPYFLLWVSIAIFHGGFFEEMIYRGFFITNLLKVFRGFAYARYFAVIMPAVLFGFRHYYYQGVYGAIATGLIGLGFGILFLAYKRNLWALILAHAFLDVLRIYSDYSGWDIGD